MNEKEKTNENKERKKEEYYHIVTIVDSELSFGLNQTKDQINNWGYQK